jgi:hypothetical protein
MHAAAQHAASSDRSNLLEAATALLLLLPEVGRVLCQQELSDSECQHHGIVRGKALALLLGAGPVATS